MTITAYKENELRRGPYAVAVLRDFQFPNSHNSTPIRITIPQAPGPFPVILFSHGAGAGKDGYAGLMRFWASHGYLCIQPEHGDSIVMRHKKGLPSTLEEIFEELKTDYDGWRRRVEDITGIIDNLSQLEETPSLSGKIGSTIAMAGHSYGAFTAQLVSGVTIKRSDRLISYGDPRISCTLLLSPQGRSSSGLGFEDGSWQDMTLPVMLMSGSRDIGLEGQKPSWRLEPFHFAPAGDKYAVFIEGADHLSFTGSTLKGWLGATEAENVSAELKHFLEWNNAHADPSESAAILSFIKQSSLAFFDAYLRHEQQAKDYLQNRSIEQWSKGKVTLSVK
jgi:predicted dienelactone hydrolase